MTGTYAPVVYAMCAATMALLLVPPTYALFRNAYGSRTHAQA
jgi:hypothetical protein